jgi:hypothetical protein
MRRSVLVVPPPPRGYDPQYLRKLNNILVELDFAARKHGQDVELTSPERLILSSPNGARWEIRVDNTGSVSAVALP